MRTIASEDPVITKETLEEKKIVDFSSEKNSKIELLCSPIAFGQMGTEALGKFLEAFAS